MKEIYSAKGYPKAWIDKRLRGIAIRQNLTDEWNERGITEKNARMLLLYAFAAEVVGKISIEPLRVRIDDMVKKRLRGELSVCENCVLHCGTPEKEIHFNIDLSKI